MLNYEALDLYRGRIQRPDRWSKYTDSINNLLYAVLLQAALDSGGYYDGFKRCDGDDARDFLESQGRIYLDYLNKQERVE